MQQPAVLIGFKDDSSGLHDASVAILFLFADHIDELMRLRLFCQAEEDLQTAAAYEYKSPFQFPGRGFFA